MILDEQTLQEIKEYEDSIKYPDMPIYTGWSKKYGRVEIWGNSEEGYLIHLGVEHSEDGGSTLAWYPFDSKLSIPENILVAEYQFEEDMSPDWDDD